MEAYWVESNLDNIAQDWHHAMEFSKSRLARICKSDQDALDKLVNSGYLMLETVCLFIHCDIKTRNYVLPREFWHVLNVEYGIIVYPTAITEDFGSLGPAETFTELYEGHIIMFSQGVRWSKQSPPPCPFEYLLQPPPVYEKEECPCGNNCLGQEDPDVSSLVELTKPASIISPHSGQSHQRATLYDYGAKGGHLND